MAIRQRGAGWQVDVMLAGTRYRPTFETEGAAIEWEAAAKVAHKLGRPIPAPPTSVTQGGGRIRTIGEMLDAVKRDRWSSRKVGDRLGRYGELFVEWKGAHTPLGDVDSQCLHDYAHYCREKLGNDNGTINRKMSSVKVLFKEAVNRRLVDQVPYFGKLPESKGSLDFLDFGEEDVVIRQLEHRGYSRYAQLVIFLIDTGCRISEALKVEYKTISHGRVRFEERKNGKFGVVPLTKRAQAVIQQCKVDGSDPLRPFGDITYRRALEHITKVYQGIGGRYGDVKQPFHIFRHSCASRLAIRGIDAKRIMEWMDHSSLVVTQRYMKLAPADLDIAAQALEPKAPNLRVVEK
ncbi:MAG: tyrosine-type recombinase/integrase [Pararhizobium sp.]